MKIVALDFETADFGADSACALGIVAIEDGVIARTEARLIRPPRDKFVFTYIHGITWSDVKDEADFGDVWDGFRDYWRDADYLVAHNAPFDRKVLYTCCAKAGRPKPETPFACTVRIAGRGLCDDRRDARAADLLSATAPWWRVLSARAFADCSARIDWPGLFSARRRACCARGSGRRATNKRSPGY